MSVDQEALNNSASAGVERMSCSKYTRSPLHFLISIVARNPDLLSSKMSSGAKIANLLLASLWITDLTVAQGRQCFFPDHSRAANFTECNAEATQSSCCRDSEACLSNGYCLQTVGLANRITRGACTDSTFSNAACPQECTDGKLPSFLSHRFKR